MGVATIHRNFETKDELIDALAEANRMRYVDLAREALEHSPAWSGFEHFILRAAELSQDQGSIELAWRCDASRKRTKTTLIGLLRELIARAQAEGSMRDDVRAEEMCVIMSRLYVGGGAGRPGRRDRAASRSLLRFVLDGMRAQAGNPHGA